MSQLTLNQHRAGITKRTIKVWEDSRPPLTGFDGLFPKITQIEKEVAIEVRRSNQLIAVDVMRGMGPNMNTFDTFSEKLMVPPEYYEGFNFNSLDRHYVSFGQNTNPSQSDALNMINQAAGKLEIIRNKILRGIQLQQAQALQTGIVLLNNGDNIDYKRKAASIGALTGGDTWNNAGVNPLDTLLEGAKFIREEGLSSGTMVNCFMGRDAFSEFIRNTQVKESLDNRRLDRGRIDMPQFNNTTGLAFHGTVAVYDFEILIWTYSDFYQETPASAKTPYLDTNKVVLVAEDFEANTVYGGLDAIVQDLSNKQYPRYVTNVEADFYVNNYIDEAATAHKFNMKSAPLAIPYSIDRVWTKQVLA